MDHLLRLLEVLDNSEDIHGYQIHHDVEHSVLRIRLLRFVAEKGVLDFNDVLMVHLFVDLKFSAFILFVLL